MRCRISHTVWNFRSRFCMIYAKTQRSCFCEHHTIKPWASCVVGPSLMLPFVLLAVFRSHIRSWKRTYDAWFHTRYTYTFLAEHGRIAALVENSETFRVETEPQQCPSVVAIVWLGAASLAGTVRPPAIKRDGRRHRRLFVFSAVGLRYQTQRTG